MSSSTSRAATGSRPSSSGPCSSRTAARGGRTPASPSATALPGRTFEPASAGLPSQGVRGFVEHAVEALEEADAILVELQDSMRPVEVGDAELRAGLAEVRERISEPPERARRFLSLLGR